MTTSIRSNSLSLLSLNVRSDDSKNSDISLEPKKHNKIKWSNIIPASPKSIGLTIIANGKDREIEFPRRSSLPIQSLCKQDEDDVGHRFRERVEFYKRKLGDHNTKKRTMLKMTMNDHFNEVYKYISKEIINKLKDPHNCYNEVLDEISDGLENRLGNVITSESIGKYLDYISLVAQKYMINEEDYEQIDENKNSDQLITNYNMHELWSEFILEEMIAVRDELYYLMSSVLKSMLPDEDYDLRQDMPNHIYERIVCRDRSEMESDDESKIDEHMDKAPLPPREEVEILKEINSDRRQVDEVFLAWSAFAREIYDYEDLHQEILIKIPNYINNINRIDVSNFVDYQYIDKNFLHIIEDIGEEIYSECNWGDICTEMEERGVRAPNERIIRIVDALYRRIYYEETNKIIDIFYNNISNQNDIDKCLKYLDSNRKSENGNLYLGTEELDTVGRHVLKLLARGFQAQGRELFSWQQLEKDLEIKISHETIEELAEIFSEALEFDLNPHEEPKLCYSSEEKRKLYDLISREVDPGDLSSVESGKYDDSSVGSRSRTGSVILHEVPLSPGPIESVELNQDEQKLPPEYEARAKKLDLLLSGEVNEHWRAVLDDFLRELHDQPTIPDPDSFPPNSVERREAAQRLLARDIIFNLAFHHMEATRLVVADRLLERICDPDEAIAGETVELLMQAADFYLDEKIPEKQRNSPVNAMISVSVLQRLDGLKRPLTTKELALEKKCRTTLKNLLINEQQQKPKPTGVRSGLTALVGPGTDEPTGTSGKNDLSRINELTDRGRVMQPFELDMLAKQKDLLPKQEIVLEKVRILGQNEKLNRSVGEDVGQIQDMFDPESGQYATELTIRDYAICYHFGPVDEQGTLGKLLVATDDDPENQPKRIDLSSEFTDLTNPLAAPPKELRNMAVGLLLARFLGDPKQQIDDFPQWLVKNGPEEARRLRLRGIHLAATAALRQPLAPVQG